MSSLAGRLSRRGRACGAVSLPRVSADTALTLGVGVYLAAVAFAADGGLRLERTTWTEIALILTGAALVGVGAAHRPRSRGGCTAG